MKKQEILSFTDEHRILILSTMNGATPEMRALLNIRNEQVAPHLKGFFKKNDRMLFTTNTHSDKIGQIYENPQASVYAYDDRFNGLLLTGRVVEVLDSVTREALWDDSWIMYYPDGRDGGDFSVLEFIPDNFKLYAAAGFTKEKGVVE